MILSAAGALVIALIATAVVIGSGGHQEAAPAPGETRLASPPAQPVARVGPTNRSFAVPAPGSSARKVFAHYFPPYPISLDNQPPASDYYARNYLSPSGEHGKFASSGGLLRDRPLGRAPLSGDWRLTDLETEVNQAADAGIDGFTVDILSLSGNNWGTTVRLMDAAVASGRNFTVVPNLDVTASAGAAAPAMVAGKLAQLYASPAAYRLSDGRYVLSSFKAEGKSVAWWSQVMSVLNSTYHVKVAFISVFLDASDANMKTYAPISYAEGWWGTRTPGAVLAAPNYAAQAKALGVKWMAPVVVQDARPKDGVYAEADNTETLRDSWKRAISDGANMVQMVTWNDYSESTSFAPSMAHGESFLDISAYYLARFKTGKYPKITSDSMYITHRIQLSGAKPPAGEQPMLPTLGRSSTAPRNTVEVLTMLTAPARLTVTIGDSSYAVNAPAGVSARTFPLRTGTVWAVAARNGTTVLAVISPYKVVAEPHELDLQYFAVSSRGR